MSVNVDKDGRRSVQVEVEVPGSPELVWEAIASGPGVSSWFVPTEIEGKPGGAITANFGPGMESTSTVKEWNPPHDFTAEGSGMSPEAPPMATQWIVEAKSGGTCIVRVVHSWFASSDEWDSQFESVEQGWSAFFKILRLKLENFPGQPSAAFDMAGMGGDDAWTVISRPFGLSEPKVGQTVQAAAGTPPLAGVVKVATSEDERHLMLLTQEPGHGICHMFAMPMGGATYVSIRFFLFGPDSADIAERVAPEWKTWFENQFPSEG